MTDKPAPRRRTAGRGERTGNSPASNAPAYRKLNDKVLHEALDLARAGISNTDLAAVLGVSLASLQRWLADGRDEVLARHTGQPPDPHRDIVVELYEGVRGAKARLAARMSLRMVAAADQGDWRAAEAVLRRWPAYQPAVAALGTGDDPIDALADTAKAEVTEAQARQVVAAMTSFAEALIGLVESEGADVARSRAGALAREALLAEAEDVEAPGDDQ